jgi:electron transfer flavoprotein alpha subunit
MNKNVFVFCEQRDGEIQKVAFELVGKARELADALGQEVVAVLAGSGVESKAQSLIAHGADKVLVADAPVLAEYSTKPYTDVLEQVIRDYAPEVVLFGASSIGRDLAPSVSATVHTGLTADCTSLAIGDVEKSVTNAADRAKVEASIAALGQDVTVEDNSKTMTTKDGKEISVVNVKYTYHKQLRMTRPAFGGNIIATIACLQHRPQMATVRPGVMQALAADATRTGEVIVLDVNPTNNVEVLETVKSAKASKDITEAKILVSAGRGIGSAEKVSMVADLADALGGDTACSRAVIDAGWMEKDRQVGQTGKTVRPELYVACGISGAIQHAAGMEGSEYIIAINKEETAPIFDIADLGIIGDVNAILPKLTEAIKKYKAEQAGK